MKDRLSFISFCKKILFPLIAFISIFFCENESHSQPYLRYFENGKVGYIDTTGKVVIKARFAQAGDFSEGLAPARLEGLYGFIDVNGNYVIPPKYDFANSFKDGFAIVYLDSMPMYIDKKGNIPFITKHKRLYDFERGIAKVETGEVYSLINKKGEIIVSDAKYISLLDTCGWYGIVSSNYNNLSKKFYVVDKSSNIIVPAGKYEWISPFHCGLSEVKYCIETNIDGSNINHWGFVNRNFDELISWKKNVTPVNYFNEGLVSVAITKDTSTEPYKSGNYYFGYMDTLGNIVVSDTAYKLGSHFKNGSAFVQKGEKWFKIIKEKNNFYEYPIEEIVLFENSDSSKLIYRDEKMYFVNSSGVIIPNMIIDDIDLDIFPDSSVLLFKMKDENNKIMSGICNKNGDILLDQVIETYDLGNKNKNININILRAVIGNKRCYVNNRGKIIWKEQYTQQTDTLNIDYIKTVHPDKASYGKITDLNNELKKNKVFILLREDKNITYDSNPGREVYIINNLKDSISVNGIGNSISCLVTCQALTYDGIWKDVENGGITKLLQGFVWDAKMMYPGEYYKITRPIYKGSIKTKLRYVFEYALATHKENNEIVYSYNYKAYSDEFEGSVNPGQFWRMIDEWGNKVDEFRDFFGPY